MKTKLKLCPYKSEGCKKYIPDESRFKTCGNLECKKVRNRLSAKEYIKSHYEKYNNYQKSLLKSFKSINIRKKIRKFCIGHYCRSEKMKWIHEGRFMCARCTEYANEHG